MATKATPESPKSARQIAFQEASCVGASLRTNCPILSAVAVTMDSIMLTRFWHTDWQSGLFDRRDRNAHADRENVRELWIALVFVDDHKTAGID